jgi:imidazolonepropionase-like amidohydrolase
MNKLAFLALFGFPGVLLAQPKAIAITHVAVIDPAAGTAQRDMIVVIEGDRISAVGKSGDTAVPDGARVVDGTGKFLIPGLWDMHVHIAGPAYLPLFIANGVTGVRDLHSFFPEATLKMRDDIRAGKTLGPRIVAAGALVDGEKPLWPGAVEAKNAEEGRAAVQSLKKRGADFIKVYTKLSRPAYLAIVEEAKKEGLTFAGHVPESMSAAEASDLGQKSMEHLYGFFRACSADEEKLRDEELAALAKVDNAGLRPIMVRTQVKALDGYSEEKAKALFARFVKNQTWQDPTLTVLRAISSLDDEKFTNDPRVKYMPAYVKTAWNPKLPAEFLADLKRLYKKSVEATAAMHQAGVPLLAGTDTTNPYCFPGFSLHDELTLLVDGAKLTPFEALRCATSNPAKFLGLEKDLGTIEKGKLADLVLLDADPLADIKNTQKIAAVVANGKLLTKQELQKMLDAAAGK